MFGITVGLLESALLGAALAACLTLLILVHANARTRRSTHVTGDSAYTSRLATLSESSVRHRFDPLVDIDWDAPDNAIAPNDSRWVLTGGPLARNAWYGRQSLDTQIAMGMWQQANIAKVTLQFESILIRGLVQYAARVPIGSPEHRYCLHETIEECNHVLMFQELVNRIGFDVPGMSGWMRRLSPLMPLYAGPFPNVFFFGVLAGEIPVDVIQTTALREVGGHPLVRQIMAVHVAEEARHIAFADAYLRKRVPNVSGINRLWMSLYVPVVMRLLAQPVAVLPRQFFQQFDVPRRVRKQLKTPSPESRQALRDMFSDIRMLCDDLGLMNPAGRLMWRLCNITGEPSRYRGEPRRTQLPVRSPQAEATG